MAFSFKKDLTKDIIKDISSDHMSEEFGGGQGRLHIYCGDGKGKTTAAVGLAVRCAGIGEDVLFAQFLKDGKSGELNILRRIPHVSVLLCGKYFGFTWDMPQEVHDEARETYRNYLKQLSKRAHKAPYRMLILDEIIGTLNADLILEDEFMAFLDDLPEEMEVVLTGRNPSEKLVERADYVTEMGKLKHPYDQGLQAREGIEY